MAGDELDDSPGQVIGLGVRLAADCERVLGADHRGTLAARFNLAYAYESAGRLARPSRCTSRSWPTMNGCWAQTTLTP